MVYAIQVCRQLSGRNRMELCSILILLLQMGRFYCATIAFSQRYYRILFGLSTQGRLGGRDMRQIGGRSLETLKMKRGVGSSRRGWEDMNRLYVEEIRQEVWTDYVWFLIGTGGRLL
jgi:hypothetical protein